MSLETWLAFVAASTVLLAIPGPTVLLVISYALAHGRRVALATTAERYAGGGGRRVALATAAGVALGDLVAITASLAGLGALLMASAAAFTAVKLAGAAYLVWLGIALWRSAGAGGGDLLLPAPAARWPAMFRHAAAVTALNPKSIGFFLAFVPQFLSPAAPLLPQAAVLVATFVALAALNAIAYAILADRLRARIARPAILAWLRRGGGAALIAMGLATAVTRRAAA